MNFVTIHGPKAPHRDMAFFSILTNYMEEAEVIELLGDMDDPEDKADEETIPVACSSVTD